MSKRSTAKTHDEIMVDIIHAYRSEHGPCEMEDVADWALANNLLDPPAFDAKKALTRKLKLAARRKRMKDAQGRTVRELVAAKIERLDANGNLIIDVVWDHLHEMSLSHALTVFSQRNEIIEMQRRSATRDLHSSLENNPNLAGCEDQFQFPFMLEEQVEAVVEEISESSIVQDSFDYTNPIVKKKGR